MTVCLGLALVFALGTGAWGAEGGKASSGSEAAFVTQVLLLLVVGRGLGEILERFGQPAVMGQLIGGILLGPSLFGWVWPDAQHFIFSDDPTQKGMINAVSQLGILLLLLLTGMETDLRLVRRVGAACVSISLTGVALPFVCGFILGQFLPDSLLPNPAERVVAGLFLGTALSISSVKIVAMIVREMNFMRRNLGQIIVSSAIIEDTIGWVIIAITFGIATNGSIQIWPLFKTVAEVAAFMAFSLTLGRRIVFTLIRWSNDVLESEFAVITVILAVMCGMALITDAIGVHTVLGAFMAGILIGESPILSGHIEEQLRGVITALFMPVFFGIAGLSADLTVLANPNLLMLTALLVVVASVGKFSGAFIGGKLGKLKFAEATAVGCAMNARGSTEVIVASIGLSMGILSHDLFTMIVTMAVVTTLAMPPMLRWALSRVPMDDGEQDRVDRESLDERGFIYNLERVLLVADGSPIGQFAARIAGLIAGSGGMPTTLIRLDASGAEGDKAKADDDLRLIETSARSSARAVEENEQRTVDDVHLTSRIAADGVGKAVAEEEEKGFDLMLVGVKGAVSKEAGYASTVEEALGEFSGASCILFDGQGDKLPSLDHTSRILVPVNGTDAARYAADFALAIARPSRARVKILYVSRQTGHRSGSFSHRREEAALKDITELGERYGVRTSTAIRTGVPADEAIRRESEKGISFIVMGARQRSGEDVFFGETTASVLLNTKVPIVLLAAQRDRESAAQRAEKSTEGEKGSEAKKSTETSKEPAE